MREYIYSLMTDKRRGIIAAILKALLSVISFFYGLVVAMIRAVTASTAKRLPCKVISVGNLTLGGTGKTPFTCRLARSLKDAGKRPAVLIRGYGDDEWKMLKVLLGDIPVIVGRDRISSGRQACEKFNADTVILDDGFQHWRLKRDLDIVLLDSTDPFGNRRIFPRGVMREDINGLKRAGLIVLTKTDMGRDKVEGVKEELRGRVPHIPIAESIHRPLGLYDMASGERIDLSAVRGKDIYVVSSIVNTAYFEYTLKELGANIAACRHYGDHYNYRKRDVEEIIGECRKRNIDTVVTTEKDAVKLRGFEIPRDGLRIAVLQVEFKITDSEGVLNDRLYSLYSA